MKKNKNILYLIICISLTWLMVSCADEENFSTSRSDMITFERDTVSLDTTFSNVPTPTQSMWVYNRSGKDQRCSYVRLESGNQTGFRVNVDGSYLGATTGFQIQDVEIRKGDSIRVFVELTSHVQNQEKPTLVSDNLTFTLESGVEQKVNLKAYSWDATLMRNATISQDSLLDSRKPIVIYGGLTVKESATLTITGGTTLYMHEDAAIHVYGSLKAQGEAGNEIVMRGDRLDNMFDYLPYDQTPGHWLGIRLYASSRDNEMIHTDLHSAYHGIVVDSSDVSKQKLLIVNSTIHNCQGYGLKAEFAKLQIYNTQISNVLYDCVYLKGTNALFNGCTLAQFYPFDAIRGASMRFSSPIPQLLVTNSLLTGYADDVLMGYKDEDNAAFNYLFDHCIIRTPKAEDGNEHMQDIIYEETEDTAPYGRKHFMKIDTDNLRYDFHLQKDSPAIDAGNPATAHPQDRDGLPRDKRPDIGCYEWREE